MADRWVDAAAKVMWSICYGKGGHKPKGEVLALPIYVPTLSYGHELWVMTKRKDAGSRQPKLVSSAGWWGALWVRSSVTQRKFRVEPLMLHIKR